MANLLNSFPVLTCVVPLMVSGRLRLLHHRRDRDVHSLVAPEGQLSLACQQYLRPSVAQWHGRAHFDVRGHLCS